MTGRPEDDPFGASYDNLSSGYGDASRSVGPAHAGSAQHTLSPEEALHKAFMQAEQSNELYRHVDELHRNQMLQQQLSLFGPVNEMLKRMYGPEFGLDLSKISTPGFAAPAPGTVGAAVQGVGHLATPEEQAKWGSGDGWRGTGYDDPANANQGAPVTGGGTLPKGLR